MPRTRRLALVTLLGSPVLLLACQSPTGPAPQQLQGVLDAPFEAIPGRPFGIRVARNGAIFVTQQDAGRITRLAPHDAGPRDSTSVGTDPGDVVLTPNGATAIVSTFIDGDLHFLDARTGDQTDFTAIGSNAYRLALSRSGGRVFVTTTNGRVFAVDVATGDKVDSVQLSGALQGIARRRDGVIAVSSSGGNITLLDPATLDVVEGRNLGMNAQEVVFAPDGDRLFVASEGSGRVMVLHGQTLATRDSIVFDGPIPILPFGMALSPNGATLLVSSPLTGALAIVNAHTGDVRTILDVGGQPRRIAFRSDGTRAYVANEADRVDVIR